MPACHTCNSNNNNCRMWHCVNKYVTDEIYSGYVFVFFCLTRFVNWQSLQCCLLRSSSAWPGWPFSWANVFVSALTLTPQSLPLPASLSGRQDKCKSLAGAHYFFIFSAEAKPKVIYARKSWRAKMPERGKLYEIYIRAHIEDGEWRVAGGGWRADAAPGFRGVCC